MSNANNQRSGAKKRAHLVIVPSISETTTWSVESQTNMRAAHPGTPVVESENVIVFAPGFRFSDFCKAKKMRTVDGHVSSKLTS